MTVRSAYKGFALPAIIFMMVIVVLLITAMTRLISTQSTINDLQLLGTRAYWAAKAGGEWAAYRINLNKACASGNLNIDGFQVAVACSSNSYTEAGANVSVYEVNVTAQYGNDPGGINYVSRKWNLVLNVEG